jgi:hypothetical protein
MSAFDNDKFSEIYPISFIMRKAISDFWVRIHSLPESKRYPEDEMEWKILFGRHRALTEEVLAEGGPCRVHFTLFDDAGFSENLTPSLDWGNIRARSYSDDETLYTRTAETVWSFDTFKPWIRRRSDDDLGWISFHSLDTDAIYSPYDGGADVFSLDPTFIAKIRSRFSAWKSPHPSGT